MTLQSARRAMTDLLTAGWRAVRALVVTPGVAGFDDALLIAYGQKLARKLSLIYLVGIFNSLVMTVAFARQGPALLTAWVPVGLVLLAASRIWHWLPSRVERRGIEMLREDIALLPLRGATVAVPFVTWALLLYAHADMPHQSLIQYMTTVTCFVGILSLGQSPRGALMMAVTVSLPATIVFLRSDHPNRVAVCATQLVVAGILLFVSRLHHRDFVHGERTRRDLARHQQDLERLADAYHARTIRDPLTGACSRARVLTLLEAALAGASDRRPWLAMVDLDGFKHVNDTYGHAAGDAVLMAVASRARMIAGIDTFGRMGGDEFAALLAPHLDEAGARAALQAFSEAIRMPIALGEFAFTVRASIGLYRGVDGAISDWLERADAALYKSKEQRNGQLVRFGDADERALRERRAMTRAFTGADLREQIAVVFQPIVDGDIGRPLGFEALARWCPDGRTLVSPGSFISLAEQTGRISEVTEVVIARALRELPAWTFGCTLSINLSAQDVLREDAVGWLSSLVRAAGAPPEGVIFEITETALLRDYRRAADNVQALRAKGFRFALDDFGTGQSSLSHVHNLPLDHIKIDHGFAQDLPTSDRARAIVGTILAMSRQLGLECTIEGIETVEQRVAARALGLRRMQGYHFARPIGASEARLLVAA